MSPRSRIILFTGLIAALAAGGTVALAAFTGSDKPDTEQAAPQPLTGTPPLVLDLGVRIDPEARALRRAEMLYSKKRRAEAGRIFARYDSPPARIGALFSAWPDASLTKLERLALARRRDSLVLLHLGYAKLWAGRGTEATDAWRRAAQAEPDTASAQRADDALHPNFPPGQPFFVPSLSAARGAWCPLSARPVRGARERRAPPRRPREAPLRARAPAPRPPALGAEAVRRGRTARSEGSRDTRRGRGRPLRQEPPVRGLLPPRPAHATLPEGRDGALPLGPPAPLARQIAARRGRAGQAATPASAATGSRVSTREGSKEAPGWSRERTDRLIDTRTYGPQDESYGL